MNSNSDVQDVIHVDPNQGSLKSYIIGFILSLVLTFAAFFLVYDNLLTGNALVGVVIGLCIAQVVVQLLFFLHLGSEPKPYWNFLVFSFMFLVLLIIVFGSLWIMHSLNYNMMPMTPKQAYNVF